MNKYIAKIPNTVYRDKTNSPPKVVAYAFLQMMYSSYYKFTDLVRYDQESFLYYIYEGKADRREMSKLAEAVWVGEYFNPVEFALSSEDNYSQVPIECLQKIMQTKYKSKIEICYYLVWLLGSRNMKTRVGHMGIEWLAEQAGISKSTAIRYNKILEELKIVYFIVGTQHNTNKYCLWEDRELIQASIAERVEDLKNNFDIAVKKYSREELEECIEFVPELEAFLYF